MSIKSLSKSKLSDNSVVCLMAPTASGKTSLAYKLYDTGRFEIISVDSALIYRDMNIGTAKPTSKELERYPHHLVDIINPTNTYSVANFVADVERLIEDIQSRGKIPLLVGGTMMYYMALFTGLSPVPDTDIEVREEVESWRQQMGIAELHSYLSEVDPVIAQRLPLGDTQRITRAVEVYKQTGRPLSYWQQLPKRAISDNPAQDWLGLAVIPDRQWLHQRIELRLQRMWEEGFFDEVISLLKKYPLSPEMPSMRCVGYRQVIDYLIETSHPMTDKMVLSHQAVENSGHHWRAADLDLACQDMKNKALYATRQLAKRQYTWLRNLVSTHSDPALFDINALDNYDARMDVQMDVQIDVQLDIQMDKKISHAALSEAKKKYILKFKSINDAEEYLFSYI